jgi:hypothetical protein
VIFVLEQPDRVDAARIQRLRLSADPDAPRLHLQRERAKRHDGPLGPFFRRLATELASAVAAVRRSGSTIDDSDQGGDRIPSGSQRMCRPPVRETPRGRRFLDEYARRLRNAETDRIHQSIEKLSSFLNDKNSTSHFDVLRRELEAMASGIAQTRREIAAIKPAGGQVPTAPGHEWAVSPYLQFKPSEFLRFRLARCRIRIGS